jgi:hypothetical protein
MADRGQDCTQHTDEIIDQNYQELLQIVEHQHARISTSAAVAIQAAERARGTGERARKPAGGSEQAAERAREHTEIARGTGERARKPAGGSEQAAAAAGTSAKYFLPDKETAVAAASTPQHADE